MELEKVPDMTNAVATMNMLLMGLDSGVYKLIALNAIAQAFGLTHWNSAAWIKLNGWLEVSPVPSVLVLAMRQAR